MRKRLLLFLIPALLVTTIAFAFTRDWDEDDPSDHSLNSVWPAEIREVMVDIAERLDDIMNGFTSGDTTVDFNIVPLNNRAADPTAVADTLNLYSKDVSAKAELFAQDEDSNEIQLTSGGALNVTQAAVCEHTYPVGSIYIATVSTDPSTLLGCGTWSTFGEGRMLISLDAGDTDFDTAEETGGAKTHTLTASEMPAHTHTVSLYNNSSSSGGTLYVEATDSTATGQTATTSSAGSGSAHSIMNPYIAVYMWERDS